MREAAGIAGVNIIAPPMWMMLTMQGNVILPSAYAATVTYYANCMGL